MKLKNLTLYALALMGLMACSDGKDAIENGTELGYLTFSLNQTDDVDNITTRADKISISNAAGTGYTTPADGDFTITITNDDDYSWTGTVAEWDSTTALKAGNYTVNATYNNGGVGFNSPIFKGSTTFAITGGQTTPVTVPVTLNNAIVRLQYNEMFKNYYSFDKFTVTSIGTAVEFIPTETRGAFVEATTFTIEGTLTSQAQSKDGSPVTRTFSKSYTAKKAQCYTISFTASNIGGNSIKIQFGDEPADTIDFGDIDLNE